MRRSQAGNPDGAVIASAAMGGAERHWGQADGQELRPGRDQGKDGEGDEDEQERRPDPDPEAAVRRVMDLVLFRILDHCGSHALLSQVGLTGQAAER